MSLRSKVLGILAFSVFLSFSPDSIAQSDPGSVDLSARETARTWFNTWWSQSYGVPMNFTGNVLVGDAGDTSTEFRNAALIRYNMFRRMVGSQPLVLDAAKNHKAQLAAMVIAANGKTAHGIDSSWKFYSPETNIATQDCLEGLDDTDPTAAWGYLYDFGDNNIGAVGHRLALLAPDIDLKVGIGNVPATASTLQAEAFALDGTITPAPYSNPLVLWPSPGHVPNYLITGQWSASIPDQTTTGLLTLRDATVTVYRNGVSIMTRTGGGAKNGTSYVWTLDGTKDGSSDYSWYNLSNGERFYGRPNFNQDVVYHVILEGVRYRVLDLSNPALGGVDLGGGAPYNGTGRIEYDVIGYNPDIATTMTVTTQPLSQNVADGDSAILTVEATGVTSCQWYKDWVAIPGATQFWLQVPNFKATDAGKYHALLQGDAGAMISSYATLTYSGVASYTASKLVNISTRSYVGPGDAVLVGGFVVTGTQPKLVLIRAAGPALTGMIPQAPLADPVLTLFDGNQKQIALNDDWTADTTRADVIEAAAKQVWAFEWKRGSKDSAILMTLAPGLYTAQVSGKANTTGIGLLEVYEVGSTGSTRMVNISGRTMNAIAGEPAVAGFVIKGTQKRKVLIRAAGPSLTGMVSTPMADPILTLFNSSQAVIATNDDWSSDAVQTPTIEAAATSTYAFAWKRGSKDAAIVIELDPGLYTAQGKGKDGATGITLVEVYEVP